MLRPLILAIALTCGTAFPQNVLRVPGQYPTISAALAAATPNATIAVAPGTYTENLTWPNTQGIRLIALAGPSVTTIDANGAGRAIMFGRVAVTRSTVVEGFTIQNGLMATSRNYGAGIHIDGGSPTIRGNVLTGHICDGPNWNYGGAIYADGGAPLIVGNTITANECRNGSWNYGAGVYVSGSTGAEIIGNTITANLGVAGHRANGVGIHVASNSTAVVSGNLVAGNSANSQYYNYGCGLYVDGATVEVVNNTFVDNVIVSTTRPYGTVYLDGAGTRFFNNIVANNTPAGIYHASGAVVTADRNCVWNNGSDYVNTTASPNDLAVDPGFVSTTDRHLSATSPCIDAGSNADVPGTVAIDMDGDPRRCDGDLDGATGNGAQVDIGGDERCEARLVQTSPLSLGGVGQVQTNAPAGWIAFTMLSGGTGNLVLEPYGTFLLDAAFSILSIGPPPHVTPIPVPPIPVLEGMVIHFQSGAVPLATPGTGTFTNRISAMIQ